MTCKRQMRLCACKNVPQQKRGTFLPCGPVRKPVRFMDVIARSGAAAPRRGNPFSLRQRKTQSTTLGEYEKRHEFAQTAVPRQAFLRRCGLPRRFAPRNDMQKFAVCPRLQVPFPVAPLRHVLAPADAYPSLACHCEPVRTLVWQSVLLAVTPNNK